MNKWIKKSLSIFLGALLISLISLQTFAIETSDVYVFKDSEGRVYEMFYENLSDDVARAYTLNSDGKVIALAISHNLSEAGIRTALSIYS